MAHIEDKKAKAIDKMDKDFIELGITARQYQRLSESDRLKLRTEFTDSEDASTTADTEQGISGFFRKLSGIEKIAAVSLVLLLFIGAMGSGFGTKVINSLTGRNDTDAANTDSNSTGHDSLFSNLNPFAAAPPPPSGTPQLTKEYIYAGDQMLSIIDAGAAEVPPTDLAIWRPSSGEWWVMGSSGSQAVTQQWGTNGDIPVPGDYDGDGKTDFCVFRPSNGIWYQTYSSGSGSQFTFGQSGDKPVPADYDGDGRTDVAFFRPSAATWYVLSSSTSGFYSVAFGLGSDIPTPADFDGDGKADIALYRSSEAKYYYLMSSQNSNVLQYIAFGQVGDKPVPGDYDGDGKADAAVWRSNYTWHILNSSTQTTESYTFGDPNSDIYVQNDYDGDGKVDRAFWRPSNGTWYIVNSSDNSNRVVQWGTNGDIPVPAFYRR